MQPNTQAPALGFSYQRGHLAEWVPVCLALGIGCYFQLRFEPDREFWLSIAAFTSFLTVLAFRIPEGVRPLATAGVLVCLGLMLAGYRAHDVAAPVLQYRYYGPIEGRIVKIDKSHSDAVRLTLDQVVLSRHEARETPFHVRVSLHGQQGFFEPEPGQVIVLTGHLSPPSGPVEPGGFDFQRQAWFARLGAVGYTRTPVLLLDAGGHSQTDLVVHRLRSALGAEVYERLGGSVGAVAAALTTGDRSRISSDVTEALRGSNLSHLLAISGLHMGLLTGFVFALARYVLAAVPPLALRFQTRKIAAVLALLAGAGYLTLSGGNVATVRAFVMVGVMFLAVLIGRRAVTLRSVAVAATIILVLTPEALTGPGFQMSFAATTALVAVFGYLSGDRWTRVPRLLRPVVTLFVSSAAAGLATAPIAAAHFNRIADYGLLANLLAVPAMGLLVMPGAVIAAVLAPAGLAVIGLVMMQVGIEWILGVAFWVSGLPGAQSLVIGPDKLVLPLFALGALFLILWQGGTLKRAWGVVPIAASVLLWMNTERPLVLVADTGGLVGVMTDQGRAVSKPRGDGFAAQSWLENDGDIADQAQAAGRSGFAVDAGTKFVTLSGFTLAHVTGRGAAARAEDACLLADVVVTTAKKAPSAAGCTLLGPDALDKLGAVAFVRDDAKISMISVDALRGDRLWSRRAQ